MRAKQRKEFSFFAEREYLRCFWGLASMQSMPLQGVGSLMFRRICYPPEPSIRIFNPQYPAVQPRLSQLKYINRYWVFVYRIIYPHTLCRRITYPPEQMRPERGQYTRDKYGPKGQQSVSPRQRLGGQVAINIRPNGGEGAAICQPKAAPWGTGSNQHSP